MEDMLRALCSIVDKLTWRDSALVAMVKALKKQVEQLKEELVLCKAVMGNDVLAMTPKHKIDALEPKELGQGLWGM